MLAVGIFLLFVASAFAHGPDYDPSENSIPTNGNGGLLEGLDFNSLQNLLSGILGNNSDILGSPGGNGPNIFEMLGNGINIGKNLEDLMDIVGNLGSDLGDKIEDMFEDIMDQMPPATPEVPGMLGVGSEMDTDMETLQDFKIPPYLPPVLTDGQIYEKIDYPSIRPTLEAAIQEVLDRGVPPTEIMKSIKGRLYSLRARCTINVMKRLISAGLTKWANEGIKQIGTHIVNRTESGKPTEDVFPILKAIKQEILEGINRTIFGSEFAEFDNMMQFIQSTITWGIMTNATRPANVSLPNAVFYMTNYLLQCENRQTFLQQLLLRIATLKRRIVYANTWTFTARILRRMPIPCGVTQPFSGNKNLPIFRIFQITRIALRMIRRELGKMLCSVETAIIFGNDSEIVDLFPNFLNNQTELFRDVLKKIRNADGPPPFMSPGANYTDTAAPRPDSPPTTTITVPTGTTPAGNPTNTPERRSEKQISKTKLLKLLLRELLDEEQKR